MDGAYKLSKISEITDKLNYIIDCLQELETIYNSGSCNDCRQQKYCSIKPEWGQLVRYNCAYYISKSGVDEDV